MRPGTLREVARRTTDDGDWEHHLREFLDVFYAHDGDAGRQRSCLADEPEWVGHERTDAVLGAVAEHLARRWRLTIPGWVRHEKRYLSTAMFWPDEKRLRGYLFCVSPVAFRARLIFTGPEPLQRARFPYRRGTIEVPVSAPPTFLDNGDTGRSP